MLPRFLQDLLSTLLVLLALPVVVARRKTRRGLRQRLGRLPPPPREGPRVWVHAASAGDVKNVWPVVRALRDARPDVVILLSYLTNSAEDMVASLVPPPDAHAYVPLDAPPFVRRGMAAWSPSLLLLEMAELWPALNAEAHRRGIPVAVCNGRISQRRQRGYGVLFYWLANPIARLARVCAQTDADLRRFVDLGADAARGSVTGNCKFDAAARTPPPEKVAALREAVGGRGPWLCAGSTHDGEEPVVCSAYAAARAAVPACRLLWAPRYLEHATRLVDLCRARGWRTARRSLGRDACEPADVVVLDTMGELAAAYSLASVAVVGGSFVSRGGQNILEPAAAGVPVLHGPYMFLAPDQVAVLDDHGARQVGADDVGAAVVRWLVNPDDARATGETGRAAVKSVSGAAARHALVLLPLLPAH